MTVRWRDLSARQGRNDLPALALTHLHDMSAADARQALCDAWTMAEWPVRIAPADIWTMAMRFAARGGGYLHEAEERPLDALPETMTVYRGASEEGALGMSWTGDPAQAAWFAERFAGPTHPALPVWRADVTRDEVLARYTEGRGEDEYVLDLEGWEMRHLTRLTPEEARAQR